jgi:hypothetical protein
MARCRLGSETGSDGFSASKCPPPSTA